MSKIHRSDCQVLNAASAECQMLAADSVLETERLLLRRLRLDDVDAIFAVIGDPIAMQYYPRTFERKDAEEWIERNLRRYAERRLWTLRGGAEDERRRDRRLRTGHAADRRRAGCWRWVIICAATSGATAMRLRRRAPAWSTLLVRSHAPKGDFA